MSWLTAYILITSLAFVMVSIIAWSELRKGDDITLQHLLVSLLCVFFPFFNLILLIMAFWYFIDVIAPRIVIFKGKRK